MVGLSRIGERRLRLNKESHKKFINRGGYSYEHKGLSVR